MSLGELRHIHLLTVQPVWPNFPPDDHNEKEGPGSYRQHDIEPFASGMQPPAWHDVPPQVFDWVEKANGMINYFEAWLTNEVDQETRRSTRWRDSPTSTPTSSGSIHSGTGTVVQEGSL